MGSQFLQRDLAKGKMTITSVIVSYNWMTEMMFFISSVGKIQYNNSPRTINAGLFSYPHYIRVTSVDADVFSFMREASSGRSRGPQTQLQVPGQACEIFVLNRTREEMCG